MYVYTNRNDDFFFATKQFSLLLLLTVKQFETVKWEIQLSCNIKNLTSVSIYKYIDFPRVLISTCVRMFVRAFVCKFVVLSFVQCTLDLEIFSIRFTLVLNVKFLVELYYTFDFVALLPDFPYTSHHHHRHLLIRVQSTACHIILVAHNRQYR